MTYSSVRTRQASERAKRIFAVKTTAFRNHRLTLRSRLVLSIVGLLAAASIVIGAVSVLALQGFLMQRLDEQLSAATGRSQGGFDPTQSQLLSQDRLSQTLDRQGPGTILAIVSNGTITAAIKNESGRLQLLTTSQNRQLATMTRSGTPQTIDLGSLGDYRVSTTVFADADLVTGLPLSDVQGVLLQLVLVIAIVTAVGLIVAALVGRGIVRVALRPLDRVALTASRVAELQLDRGEVALAERVPDADADPRTEVGQVGASINRMLGHVASALTARQESERKVRQFVADASHELRTPLASIRGYAELTRRGNHDLPDDVVHSIGRVESEALRMTSLVEDLLLLARLDEGRDLEKDEVDLSRLLIDAVSDAHAAGPHHVWSLDLPDDPVYVDGDQLRLHQVIANLLTNARVHTPAGTPITVALAAGERAYLTITDQGPGIPEALQPTLFERFARGDSSRSRIAGSTGLGLAIVLAVVEGLGGEVRVESRPGRTVFTVELPLA